MYIVDKKKQHIYNACMTLKDWLLKNDINQTEFAIMLGISRYHISRIVNGHYMPSRDLAKRIEAHTYGEIKATALLNLI